MVAQVQRVDAHVSRDGQTFFFGSTHQLNAFGAGDAAQVHAGAGSAHEREDGVQGNGLCGHRHAAQTQSGGEWAAGCDAFAQMHFLRTQPYGVAKSGGVLQGALQHLRVFQRNFSLAKAHTACIGEV